MKTTITTLLLLFTFTVAQEHTQRGQYPVGVKTRTVLDTVRNRELTMEIWYPATEDVRGKDLKFRTMDFFTIVEGESKAPQKAVRNAEPIETSLPLLIYSHGKQSHRRSADFLCTHLASHGFLVVAPDHAGNTLNDFIHDLQNPTASKRTVDDSTLFVYQAEDLLFLKEYFTQNRNENFPSSSHLAGMIGHSFGGFSVLRASMLDSSIPKVAALAPVYGDAPYHIDQFKEYLDHSKVNSSTLMMAGEFDRFVPVKSVQGQFNRLTGKKQLIIVPDGSHASFNSWPRQNQREMKKMMLSPEVAGMVAGETTLGAIAENMISHRKLLSNKKTAEIVNGTVTQFFQ